MAAKINFKISILPYNEENVAKRLFSMDHNKVGPVKTILPKIGKMIIENRGIIIEIIRDLNSFSFICNIFGIKINARNTKPPIQMDAAIP